MRWHVRDGVAPVILTLPQPLNAYFWNAYGDFDTIPQEKDDARRQRVDAPY